MKIRINRLILLLISCTTVMTGCWDYYEIHERGYVLGFAIDKASIIDRDVEDEAAYNRELETMELEEGKPEYAYTIQLPIIARSQSKPTGQGAPGGDDKERVWNLTVTGNSLFEAQREYSTRTDYPPFFEHIQSIIISEDVARNGVVETLDMFIRDPEMRRRMKVFVTPGEARKLLDIEPKIEDYSAMYIADLTENIHKTSRMPHSTDFGKMAENLHSNRSFILPRITTDSEEVKYAGGAVFKEGRMLGWLGELDVNYLNWAADEVKGGTIAVPMPDHPGDLITLEISSVESKVKPEISDDTITLHLKSKARVYIAEQFRDEFYNTFYVDFTKKFEAAAEKKIEKGIKDTIEYVQREYGTDVFFFYKAMERYEPDTWDKVKDNWDEVFEDAKIDIDVDIKMVQRGLIK